MVMMHTFHGAILSIGLSVKSDCLIAMGGFHLRYLQFYEDQASYLGEPRRPAICLTLEWVGIKALSNGEPSLPSSHHCPSMTQRELGKLAGTWFLPICS